MHSKHSLQIKIYRIKSEFYTFSLQYLFIGWYIFNEKVNKDNFVWRFLDHWQKRDLI